ncbi:NADH:flavin oxidoreductase/NADH oxidase family protein [Penicillium ucsense]|uniref:NADH:flavin oxidoreductase/NADH oxidase family protein n=1 Tax=Penicillium ucsense TaxID=2839758 RepID=A0A8J8W073_9EURO|nr:NADH:flavin oxidoreductase/NADH oxidase family protein [Penicillium ucsense]KAF7734986.1 NADH:flavin oxidoreductase/NADH oxidase family protein [Penicillium ucsense]
MTWADVPIAPAPGISYFTPAQYPPAGTARNPQTSGKPVPKLFKPLTIRGQTFQNRLGVAPMCQYSAQDGHMTPWHMAHYGGIAQRGPGMIIIEATGVLPEGRITPGCVGLWKDSQIAPLKEVVEFAHSQGQKIGIQLAHAGRKASTVPPWLGGMTATNAVGGWTDNVKAPSAIPFSENDVVPKEMTKEDIVEVKNAWVAATKRALAAGVDFIEIHNAHGYLLSSFLSTSANQRTDEYGGSFENRIRLSLEIAQLTRDTVGPNMPVFLRVSATDWLEDHVSERQGWSLEDTVEFSRALAKQGAIDLIDISSGGVHAAQKITSGPAFQVPFAAAVKKAVGDKLIVAAVGMINNGNTAEKALTEDDIDVILVGRAFQRDTGLTWAFAKDLDVEIAMAGQIRWGFTSFRNASEYIQPNSMKASIFD